MKIDRKKLEWYLKNIRTNSKDKEITDEELVDQLATWIERNPGCVDVKGVSDHGRVYYSTVGYGVFSLMGEKYRMGRVEIFDSQDESGYAVSEGIYTMPHVAANQFEDFIDSLQTDLPINIEIGSHEWCEKECATDLGFETPAEMRDPEKIKEFQKKKNDEYAVERGFKDFDELWANSKFGGKAKEQEFIQINQDNPITKGSTALIRNPN